MMKVLKRYRFWIDLALILGAVVALTFVARSGDWRTMALAMMAAVYLVARGAVWFAGPLRGKGKYVPEAAAEPEFETAPVLHRVAPDANDQTALVEHMLTQGRFALLLREQIACNLSVRQRDRALAALDHGMAIVPEGDVLICNWRAESDEDDVGV